MRHPPPIPDAALTWRQPSVPDRRAVDAVEVAQTPDRVLVRSSLGRTRAGFTPAAWAAFVAAVKAGEYDV